MTTTNVQLDKQLSNITAELDTSTLLGLIDQHVRLVQRHQWFFTAHKQPYELILQETLYNIQELNNKK